MKRMISILLVLLMMLSSFSFADTVENQYGLEASLSKEIYSSKEGIEISGTISKNGVGFSYTPVFIKVWHEENIEQPKLTGEVSTDTSGNFYWGKSLVGLQDGKYIVKAESQIGLSKDLEFYVTSNSSMIELSKANYRQGEEVKISGVAYNNGEVQPYASINIKVYLEGQEKFVDDLTADKDGEFNSTWSLPSDQEVGDYIVQVNISGEEILEEEFAVEEELEVYETTLELDKESYYRGESVAISGKTIINDELQSGVVVNIKVLYENEVKFEEELTTDSQGEYRTTYQLASDQDLGNYDVKADMFDKIIEKSFEVKASGSGGGTGKSILELDKSTYKPGEEVKISGTAYNDGEMQPYASVNIKVYLNDEEKFVKDLTADKNGQFSTVWNLTSDQELGSYTVVANTLGETLEEGFAVEENPQQSILEIDKSSYKQGEEVNISGTAYNDGEIQPYASVNIKIYLDDEEKFVKDLTADKNGQFTAVWSLALDQEIGNYRVEAEILGETFEEGFTVEAKTNESTLVLDSESYYRGDIVTISGKAILNNELQSGAVVNVKVLFQEEVKFEEELTTDSQGEYKTTYQLTLDQELGNYDVKVEIFDKTIEDSFEVKESGGGTGESILELDKSSYKPGDEVHISGITYRDGDIQPYASVNIKVYLNGEEKFVKGLTSDKYGEFSTVWTLSEDQELGKYTIQVDISGEETLEKEFTVEEEVNESTLVLDDDSYYRGETVTISGKAMLNNEAQADTEVSITILYDGEVKYEESITTDSEGNYETTYKLDLDQELGDYTVQAEILGATLEAKFEVEEESNESTLELDKESYYRGETVSISGRALLNDEAKPNSEVNIKILYGEEVKHEENITADTMGNYEASYELSLDQELGNYTVVAEILGETLEEGFTVEAKTNESTLILDKESYYRGDTVTISGKAILNNELQSGATVSVKVLHQNVVKFEKELTTDLQGEYKTTYQLASNQDLGDYKVTAEILDEIIEKSFTVKQESSSGGGGSGGSGGNTEKETKKIKPSGGKAEMFDGEVILDFEEGTFDSSVNISVEIIDEDDVTLPQSTSTAKLMIAGKIYEFDSNGATFNKPVSITLEYDTDNVKNPKKLGVYFYNEETKDWEYIGGKVDSENGTITVELQHFSKYAVMEFDKTFDDIDIPWAKEQIEVLASRHIIDGINETSYAPNAKISRAAFAKLLVNALGLEAGDKVVSFNDIEEGMWYTESVEIAASLDIIKGYGDDFNPNGEITREAMAVMIVRALKQVDPDGDYTASELGFEDADSISDWAKDEVGIASDKGLITGVSDTEFAPNENATRAQAAVIIYRLLELLGRL